MPRNAEYSPPPFPAGPTSATSTWRCCLDIPASMMPTPTSPLLSLSLRHRSRPPPPSINQMLIRLEPRNGFHFSTESVSVGPRTLRLGDRERSFPCTIFLSLLEYTEWTAMITRSGPDSSLWCSSPHYVILRVTETNRRNFRPVSGLRYLNKPFPETIEEI